MIDVAIIDGDEVFRADRLEGAEAITVAILAGRDVCWHRVEESDHWGIDATADHIARCRGFRFERAELIEYSLVSVPTEPEKLILSARWCPKNFATT